MNDAIVVADHAERQAWRDMVAAAPHEVIEATGLAVHEVAGATVLVAPKIPHGNFNRAIGLGTTADATPKDVDAILDVARQAKCARFWIHTSEATRPTTLVDWLAERGLTLVANTTWAKMLHGGATVPRVSTRLRVIEVAKERADELARVLTTALTMPPWMRPWASALVGRRGWHAYAALEDEQIVAGGMLYVADGHAWLGMTGTLPSHQRLGAQGALLERRIDDAMSAGIRHIATETGSRTGERSASLSNMLRLGFIQVSSRHNHELRT